MYYTQGSHVNTQCHWLRDRGVMRYKKHERQKFFHISCEKKYATSILTKKDWLKRKHILFCRKVPVVGITSLGIDHVSLLGSTLDKIAWNKAGIMKENCRAFSVPQPKIAMDVLEQRSVEKKCRLDVINGLGFKMDFIGPKDILDLNAGLAVALCEAWLTQSNYLLLTIQKINRTKCRT